MIICRYDASYSMDAINRLKRDLEGKWNGSSISTARRDERWLDASGNLGLSQTGNWAQHRLDLNGDGALAGPAPPDNSLILASGIRVSKVPADIQVGNKPKQPKRLIKRGNS